MQQDLSAREARHFTEEFSDLLVIREPIIVVDTAKGCLGEGWLLARISMNGMKMFWV